MKTISFSGKCENGFRVKDHIDPETDTVIFKNFDTSETINMSYMFADCSQLKHIIGLETFNTSNVQDMSFMFRDCDFENIDMNVINNWNVKNITDTGYMFYKTQHLETAYLPDWETPNLRYCDNMFSKSKDLKTVRLDKFGCSKHLSNCYYMFERNYDFKTFVMPVIYMTPKNSRGIFVNNCSDYDDYRSLRGRKDYIETTSYVQEKYIDFLVFQDTKCQ